MIIVLNLLLIESPQMGEEESRAWQRGANSDASLRPFGEMSLLFLQLPPGLLYSPENLSHHPECLGPPGKRPPSPTGGRGRGRGRGSSIPYYDR